MSKGIYFLNNFGGNYCYNDLIGIWEIVNPHNHVAKTSTDKLLAASDNNFKAYVVLEGDKLFKFNEIDMSYVTLHNSVNNNWLMKIY